MHKMMELDGVCIEEREGNIFYDEAVDRILSPIVELASGSS